MKRFLVFLILSITLLASDIKVTIGEDTINSFVNAMGPVNGRGQINLEIIKVPYTYLVENSKIKLKEEKVIFEGDISLNLKGTVTKGKLTGNGNIRYNKEKRVLELSFDNIALEGLEDLNLGDVYKPYFEIPFTYFENETIKVKNGNEEIELLLNIKDENLEVSEGYITVSGNIGFERK